MVQQAPPTPPPAILLNARNGLILHQALYAVARLGVADCLQSGWRSVPELATQLKVNEDALYRVLRLLASQGIFEENADRCSATRMSRTSCDPMCRTLFALSSSSGALTSATRASARWRALSKLESPRLPFYPAMTASSRFAATRNWHASSMTP